MIIVMEMTDGHSMVLSLITCALLSSLVSRMISRPLYSTMSTLMMRSLRGAPMDDTHSGHVPLESPPAAGSAPR
jgi:H+/Cl- antiporter ClcA